MERNLGHASPSGQSSGTLGIVCPADDEFYAGAYRAGEKNRDRSPWNDGGAGSAPVTGGCNRGHLGDFSQFLCGCTSHVLLLEAEAWLPQAPQKQSISDFIPEETCSLTAYGLIWSRLEGDLWGNGITLH